MEQLSQLEIQFVKELYKIRKELGELNLWFKKTEEAIAEGKDFKYEVREAWARKYGKKLYLEKKINNMFSMDCLPEHEREIFEE